MNITLWILQGLVAIFMLLPGVMKLTNTKEQLIKKGNGQMNWAEDVSPTNLKIIGLLEVLAAAGLLLPMSLGILPILTPFAALGAGLTMIGAMALHIKRGDGAKAISINVMILLLAVFIAYGRLVLLPI